MKHNACLHLIAAGSAALFIAALASCNTTAGLGRDVQSAGRTIEREAHQAKH